jgi:hypothetical protein
MKAPCPTATGAVGSCQFNLADLSKAPELAESGTPIKIPTRAGRPLVCAACNGDCDKESCLLTAYAPEIRRERSRFECKRRETRRVSGAETAGNIQDYKGGIKRWAFYECKAGSILRGRYTHQTSFALIRLNDGYIAHGSP